MKRTTTQLTMLLTLGLAINTWGCSDDTPVEAAETGTGDTSGDGDGDGDTSGDGDGDTSGDGDGDPAGDGDGDTAGDGDGDTAGDGDGDTTGEPECGNGVVEDAEECDDGNDVDDDECSNACTLPVCGDGAVAGTEDCDDGNDVDDDECPNSCTTTCGDGLMQGSEECDDGNDVDDDECSNACALPVCGDGIVAGMESCDDGNDVDDDECPNSCMTVCGDSLIQGSEECDDGNDVALDGCSSSCEVEVTEDLLNIDDLASCTVQLGCSDPDGTAGNPQDLAECYTVQDLEPPFDVVSFSYEIGASIVAPDALDIVVWEWDGVGAPGNELSAQPVPMENLAHGPHTVILDTPVEVSELTFCVGLRGTDEMDGFRALSSAVPGVPDSSWIDAELCGLTPFTPMGDINQNNWCFGTTVLQ